MMLNADMDNAYASLASPPPTSPVDHVTAIRLRRLSSPTPLQSTPSRQQRLLESRNARFAGKKLSITDLGTKFTKLINANNESHIEKRPVRDQENTSSRRDTCDSVSRVVGSALSIRPLDEISNTNRSKSLPKKGAGAIQHERLGRPRLNQSTFSSPTIHQDSSSGVASPVGFDTFQDSLDNMHLQEVSGNEHRRSPLPNSPLSGSMRAMRKQKSAHFKPAFDAQEYIDHIEKELQQTREELYSPTTNRSLKEQSKAQQRENDRLKQEIRSLRAMFESEVKGTIEHKMAVEAELKLKIRDMEEELERKDMTIRELEYKHEDKRLDTNTVETLRMTIERLEEEKAAMEDENRSMSKRNEVLSELLAMSPTKSQPFFELRSPTRERRVGRPMSLILPRLPSSPTFRTINHNPSSSAASPSPSIRGLTGLPQTEERTNQFSNHHSVDRDSTYKTQLFLTGLSHDTTDEYVQDEDTVSRGSGVDSQAASSFVSWSQPLLSSPNGEAPARLPSKRKPRKFMSGSTQLKPLLLPALTADNVGPPSASTPASSSTSPGSVAVGTVSREPFDPTTHFWSQPPEHDVIESQRETELAASPSDDATQLSSGGHILYQTLDGILAKHDKTPSAPDFDVFGPHNRSPSSPPGPPGTRGDFSFGNTKRASIQYDSYTQADNKQNLDSHQTGQLHRIPLNIEGLREYHSSSSSAPSDEVIQNIGQLMVESNPSERTQPVFSDPSLSDIPRPLFSPLARKLISSQHQNRTSIHIPSPSHILTTQLHSRKRRQSGVIIGEEQVPSSLDSTNQIKLLPAFNQSLPTSSFSGLRHAGTPYSSSVRSSTPRASASLAGSKSPLEILQQRHFGAKPLAALTIRTIYGTISRYTSYIRELKRDPVAVARRFIASLWYANWARLGGLSWWVLGIFIPYVSNRRRMSLNLDQYDGEYIAQQIHDAHKFSLITHKDDELPEDTQEVQFDIRLADHGDAQANSGQEANSEEPGWGRSLMLWSKFSAAILLTIRGAVMKGPGEMLKDIEHQPQHYPERSHRRKISSCRSRRARHNKAGDGNTQEGYATHSRAESYDESLASCLLPGSTEHQTHSHHRLQSAFSFRSDQEMYGYDHVTAGGRSVDDDTLRPFKSQKTHVTQLFRLTDSAEDDDQEPAEVSCFNRYTTSYPGSIEEGLLQWPPSPSSIYPNDNMSVEGTSRK